MKKLIALILSLGVLVSAGGCAQQKEPASSSSIPPASSSENSETSSQEVNKEPNTGAIVEDPITLKGFVYENTAFNANYDEMPFWTALSE